MSTQPSSEVNEFPIWRRGLAILVSFIVGFMFVALIEALSLKVHPPPADLDQSDLDALGSYIKGLPVGAFLFLLAAHGIGSLMAGFACAATAGRKWYLGSGIIGQAILSAGVLNLIFLPHPVWFAVIDVNLYVPFALLGCLLASAIFKMK